MSEKPNNGEDIRDFIHRMDSLAIKKQKEEIERLKGIIIAQSSDFVRSKTADSDIKPEGHNDLAGRAVEYCLKLKAEVERLNELANDPYRLSKGWRPIETAPMDGTDILCWCVEPEFEGEENPHTEQRVCFFGQMQEDYSCWMSHYGYEQRPTHWMPLPKPPTK